MLRDASRPGDTIADMLSLLRPLFAATLLLPLAASAQDAPAPAPPPASNHFHSDILHLSFDVPDDILEVPSFLRDS